MTVNTNALVEMKKLLPFAGYCHGAERSNKEMIDLAITNGIKKVQFVTWYPYDKEMVELCHNNGIACNICLANKPGDAKMLLDMGFDCILTNDYHTVKSGLEEYGVYL